jgi:hypothetical protein
MLLWPKRFHRVLISRGIGKIGMARAQEAPERMLNQTWGIMVEKKPGVYLVDMAEQSIRPHTAHLI